MTVQRTIPDEAWAHVAVPVAFEGDLYPRSAVFRDGHLYPDVWHIGPNSETVYEDSDDADTVRWLSYFTLDNYAEWAGAVVIGPRAPCLEETMVRFDAAREFIAHGYHNPYREPGTPEGYFFWVRNYSMTTLKKWAREQGLLPQKDIPKGRGGYGFDIGLRNSQVKALIQRQAAK